MDAADNFNASANNAGIVIIRITNASACNYDPIHNVEDGSCTYADSWYDQWCLSCGFWWRWVCDAFELWDVLIQMVVIIIQMQLILDLFLPILGLFRL